MKEINKFPSTQTVSLQTQKGENEKPGFRLSRQITQDVDMFYYKTFCRKKETHITNKKNDNHMFVIVFGDSCVFKYRNGKSFCPKKYDLIFSNREQDEILEFNESVFYENLSLYISSETIRNLANKKGFKNYSAFLPLKDQLYIKRANLKILKKARQICDEASEDMKVVGHIFLLAELIIQQYLNDYLNPSPSDIVFKEWEISELLRISREIRDNPGENYSVNRISEVTGIKEPRLQAGFKEMHDLTVALYIKEMRLQKAEQLIRKTELNISEIVYKIGLSSRSYFSRIFKHKYKCSPSNYKKYYF